MVLYFYFTLRGLSFAQLELDFMSFIHWVFEFNLIWAIIHCTIVPTYNLMSSKSGGFEVAVSTIHESKQENIEQGNIG